MSDLEAKIEREVVRWAMAHGILTLKLNLIGNTGWPDRIFLHQGEMVFVEFKRPGEQLRRNQPERVAELRKRKFKVGVFDNVPDATAFLEASLLSS